MLDKSFKGTFSIRFDPSMVYTHKSQHLKNVTLSGNNPVRIVGNDWGNHFTGNGGDNEFVLGKGNDVIDGGAGNDRAVFQGKYSDFIVKRVGENISVKDKRFNTDGHDLLVNIEWLQFSDRAVGSDTI